MLFGIQIFSILFFFMTLVSLGEAVTCHTCKDTIVSCTGGNGCPLLVQCAANAAALVAGSIGVISLKNVLPARFLGILSRSIVDRLAYLANRASYLPFDPTGKSATDIYTAVTQGQMGKNEAQSALVGLLSDTSLSDAQRTSVSATAAMMAAMSVPADQSRGGSPGVGHHLFLLAVLSRHVESSVSSSVTLSGDGGSGASSTTTKPLEAKLVPPSTDYKFYELLNLFVMFCHALGGADCILTTAFISQVVFEKMRRRGYSWMMGYELLVVFLKAVDESDDPSVTLANVHADGGLDGHTEEAEAQGVVDYGKRFRKLRGESASGKHLDDGERSVVWNKKDTPTATKACISYNRGTAHPASSLLGNGTCKFKHVCFKWVSGQGKNAICGSTAHIFGDCDNPDRCESPQA